MTALIAIIIAYLIGSISSSIIIAKLTGQPDPRTQGSKNAGATNTLRTSGKKAAAIVLIGDLLKGLIAIFIARFIGVDGFALGLVVFACVAGHVFPCFFQFKGGKGVATTLGALLALSPLLGILVAATWILVAILFRFSSLASLVAAVCAPIYVLIFIGAAYFLPTLLVTVLIFWKHKDNIQRLREGKESKINL